MWMFELPDGRMIAYETWGKANGKPVLFCHGTGESRLARNPREKLTEEIGVRLITFDRPGVGGSSQNPGRSILDWADDVARLADFLKLGEFALAGHSGGGPHALGIAHRLGDRVSKISLASPFGPLNEPGARDLVVGRDLKALVELRHRQGLLRQGLHYELAAAERNIGAFLEDMARHAPSDAATLLDDPEMNEMFGEEMGAAFLQGEQAMLDDVNAFFDWGFKPEDIRQPVSLFYGDADAMIAPEMPKKLGQRLPNCRVAVWPGAGHFACFDHWQEFIGGAL